jgi:hypothetical protein
VDGQEGDKGDKGHEHAYKLQAYFSDICECTAGCATARLFFLSQQNTYEAKHGFENVACKHQMSKQIIRTTVIAKEGDKRKTR